VESFLRRCPNLHVLITSRELLDVDGEVGWQVPSLGLPSLPVVGIAPDVREVAVADAVRLFSTRAAERQAGFQLTEDNAESVSAICRRLDGIPLALELAAGVCKMMP
jgi:predicted ATPase